MTTQADLRTIVTWSKHTPFDFDYLVSAVLFAKRWIPFRISLAEHNAVYLDPCTAVAKALQLYRSRIPTCAIDEERGREWQAHRAFAL